jgi:arylsulfatase A-like enzyme/tetratricopeptide (TPR) repeat protein
MAKKKRSRSKKQVLSAPPAATAQAKTPVRPPPGEPKPAGEGRSLKRPTWRVFGPVAAGAAAVAGAAVILYFAVLKPKPVLVLRDETLNVLLVTLDTTRADRVGCYGYAKARTPNLDALARNGVRFANAYAPAPLTLPSHASILTGLTPLAHGVHNNGSYVLSYDKLTLAELLRDKGVTTGAFVASFSVDSRFGLDQGFDVYDDNFQEGSPFKALNAERKAEQVLEPFSNWLDRIGGERFFAWVHFFDPHLPYSPPSPYRENFEADPYDGEIAYLDFVLGEVLGRVRDKGILSRTLIVVAGDHGEAFGEKGESGHGVFLYEMAVRVPLLFYSEGHLPANRVVEARVRLIDILPTVLDVLGMASPEGVQGQSLIPYIQRRSGGKDLDTYLETYYPRENFGWAPLTGIISGKRKFIQAPKPELYDLAADPNEGKNLVDREGKALSGLKARLETVVQAVGGTAAEAVPRELSADERARLRSLGYVDYSEPGAKGDADPKDRLDELKMVQDAEKAEYDGNFILAAELHEKMLALRPGAASSYVNLALARARQKDFDGAVETLKTGLEKLPGNELLMSRLGYTYLVMNKWAEAMETMSELLKANPRSIDALTAVAVILDGTGRKAEAREYFESALSVEPENKFLRVAYAGNLASTRYLAEAIGIYEKLVIDFPRDTSLYRALGIAYGIGGNFDEAIKNFKQITYIAPTPDAYYNLAVSYRQKGDIAEAVANLERYLDDPKDEPPAKVERARTELQKLKTIK